MSTPPIKTALFDLDGTLIDHFETIYRCYDHALSTLGLESRTYETVKASVGGGIRMTFSRLVPEEHIERSVELWSARFAEIWSEGIVVLPGAEKLVKKLKESGVKTAIYTNKEGDVARKIAALLGWEPLFDGIYGRLDTDYTKPDIRLTDHVLSGIDATAEGAVMIGDSPFDWATAHNANFGAYLVATGSHTLRQLKNETTALGIYPNLVVLARKVWDLDVD
jgi:phosphoglycolate phosphatase-like HAD superfamily hydrolase|tara:strand:+ start:633 stop:1298 length:666 start_codon:yes stop_codon:yes gene_type:complete